MSSAERTSWALSSVQGFADALNQAAVGHCHGWPNDDGELNAAEGVRQTIRLACAGIVSFLESDPDYPELIKQQTLRRQMQLPSPDAVYHYARLHGRNTYRIRGNRGTAHVFQISVWRGSCSNLRNYQLVDKIDNYTSTALTAGAAVDIVLSATAGPQPRLRLPPDECEIFVRQYYGDWDTETPATLTIEREGAIYPPPPPSRSEITARLNMVGDWLRTQTAYFDKSIKFHLSSDPSELPRLDIPEAFQDNVYLNGHYRCAPDEALILEVTPPKAVYWGFQLANLQWEAMEYHMRQTSLNFRQAVVDEDGGLRIVISQADPGVFNWLDSSGRSLGLLVGRYYKAAGAPIPTLRKVPLRRVREHLPSTTRLATAAQRQDVIVRRMRSAFRRLCGDQ